MLTAMVTAMVPAMVPAMVTSVMDLIRDADTDIFHLVPDFFKAYRLVIIKVSTTQIKTNCIKFNAELILIMLS